MKGVAGNIGATEVQQTAAVVEGALKENTEKGEQLKKLDNVLSALIENLERADLNSKTTMGDEKDKDEIDPEMLMELFKELKPVLEKRKPNPAKEDRCSGKTDHTSFPHNDNPTRIKKKI